VTKQTRM